MCQGMKKCYGEPNGHEAGYGGNSQGNIYGNSPFHDPTLKKIPFKIPSTTLGS